MDCEEHTAGWTISAEMIRRGWRAHEWKPREQAENAVTRAIFNLMDPTADHELAWLLTDALLSGLTNDERTSITRQPLWGFLPAASPGPDLTPVDSEDRTLVVVEHKRDAASNAGRYARSGQSPRFPDRLARSLPDRPRDDEHVPGGVWGNSGGMGPLLWQIDFYRCYASWVRPQVTLIDPESVHWIFLDRYGRSAAQAFPGAHTAHVWRTTSYHDFARHLFAGHDDAIEKRRDDQAQKLRALIRMLDG